MNMKTMKLRPIKIVKDYLKHAEGSCLFSLGKTVVLCVATVENRVPPHIEKAGLDQGWVTAEYSMMPRAGKERTPRQRGASGGRTQEISRLIGRSLRGIVDMTKLGKRTIILDCDVIQADGGTRTASINGAFIALTLALKKLYREKLISELPVKDYLAAISVGIVGSEKILDLCAFDDNKADVDMNLVMTGAGSIVEIQGTAEGNPFSVRDLDSLLAVGSKGIKQIIALEKKMLGPLK
jgi:ribonuclease PH